jgi:hypothetical protein
LRCVGIETQIDEKTSKLLLTSETSFGRHLPIDGGTAVTALMEASGILALHGGRDGLRFFFLSLRDEIFAL